MIKHLAVLFATFLLSLGTRAQGGVCDTVLLDWPQVDFRQTAGQMNPVQPQDTLQAFLLTCAPGDDVYAYYGHTALWVHNLTRPGDYVFNYGVFNFDGAGFAWRFMLGETDYCASEEPLPYFLYQYILTGREVHAALLNLTQAEAHALYDGMHRDAGTRGWTYHYNLFEDNCATRVRDHIEGCLDGTLQYRAPLSARSLRDIVHASCRDYRWSYFGQDLLLGAAADTVADRRLQHFSPIVLGEDLEHAVIVDAQGTERPLVLRTGNFGIPVKEAAPAGFPLSPMVCTLILLALTVLCCGLDWLRRRPLWLFDVLLFLAWGISGLIVTFMFFLSQHPTVDSNWLVLWLNCLPLGLLWPLVRAERRNQRNWWHIGCAIWTALFIILSPLMPQYLGLEIRLLALGVLLRLINAPLVAACAHKSNENPDK